MTKVFMRDYANHDGKKIKRIMKKMISIFDFFPDGIILTGATKFSH